MKVYRYEIDQSTDRVEKLHMSEYEVKRLTPKGYVLDVFGKEKFSHKNCWACETPKKALESFILRKENQINICRTNITRALKAIQIAKNITP